MESDRRTFLKTTALVGGATALAGIAAKAASTPAAAQTASPGNGYATLPRGMTFCTLRRAGGGLGLGLRTPRGILDVVAAEEALKQGAPTSIAAVLAGQGNLAGLQHLAGQATPAHFIAEDTASFGPAVTSPEKIVCIGLNYRRHAAEVGAPVPTMPILFNKFNTALNYTGGEVAVSKEKAEQFDYEAELVG